MSVLNEENIKSRFCELTHLDPTEAEGYSSLITAARDFSEKRFLREPVGEEIAACEYAAACKAFYDYTALRIASENSYATVSGGASLRTYQSGSVTAAENLWKQALAALPDGLCSDVGFVFEGAAG